jgi:RNA polymerase sigma factor (sigma-70 family)
MATCPRQSTRRCPAASDAALVRRAADGDQAAWHAVVQRYSGLLRSVVRGFGLTDAQAADAVQSTWLRLLEDGDAMRHPERLADWLRAAARRECLRLQQEEPADPHSLEPVADPSFADPETRVLGRERAEQVRAAVRDLPEQSRRMVALLVATPPLSDEEIGARLDLPAGSVGPARTRVLARLRTSLADADLRDAA